MAITVFNKYKQFWVLSSAARVIGGGTIDVEPVRLIDLNSRGALAEALETLIAENQPVVPEPDWNDRQFAIGIRAEAVGAKTWAAFARGARAFKLEHTPDGLMLEEWPREGGSFSANAAWRKLFPHGAFESLVEYLLEATREDSPPTISKHTSRSKRV